MINANEIRIGNYVLLGKNFERIYQITFERGKGHSLNHTDYKEDWFEPIPLTPEILEKCGFNVDVWSRISLGLDMVGEDGIFNLVLGRCSSSDGLPYSLMIEQSTNDGFTIKEAAEIQKKKNEIDDEAFILKKKDAVTLYPIKYLHQLQNLYFALTNEELELSF